MKNFKRNIYSTVNDECVDCSPHDVIIGTQTWTGCNLDVDQYTDGTSIPNISVTLWDNLTTGAWCYYNNDPVNAKYGKLYNWYAAMGIHDGPSLTNPALRKRIAPIGYKVPSNADWTILLSSVGGTSNGFKAGTKLKESGTCHWLTPNTGTNASGFGAFAAGTGSKYGFVFNGQRTYFWSTDSTQNDVTAGGFGIFSTNIFDDTVNLYNNLFKAQGLSIRLIQEPVCTPSCGAWSYTYTAWSAWSTCAAGTQTRTRTANGTRTCILADCSTNIETSTTTETESQACVVPCPDCIANDVIIGTQTWSGCNANVEYYRNGDPIPYVDDPTTWQHLTTGAWCWYNNDPANESKYGKLYNFYAVTDSRKLAPTGYHVPTNAEWTTLTNYLGANAGKVMKESGLCHWLSPNTGTNTSNFTALAGGYQGGSGYAYIGDRGFWWTSTFSGLNAYIRFIYNNFDSVDGQYVSPYLGASVRFVKDPVVCTPSCGAWSYTYTAWSAWDTCAAGTQSRTRTANGTRTCILADCSTNIETSTAIETESQACVVPCPDCIANDLPPIGTQTWSGCNATVAVYNNGDPIPYVDDAATWASLTTGAWCYHNNDPSTEATYGKLYNAYAVSDTRGFAPVGYRVPTDSEWTTLATFLGGDSVAGGKMKEPGLCHWISPNSDATNTSQFTGLPGGNRGVNGSYFNLGFLGNWWSSTEANTADTWARYLKNNDGVLGRNVYDKNHGFSVRFIKDTFLTCPNVKIGTQTWTGCNLNVDQYSDGTTIPQVADYNTWKTLTTGAWTYATTHDSGGTYYKKYYNWYAVAGIYDAASLANPALRKKLAPDGYHVPTTAEWNTLATYLGGLSVAGGELKEVGTTYWVTSVGATNSTGFSARGGGYRDASSDNFKNRLNSGHWWTSSPVPGGAHSFSIWHFGPALYSTLEASAAGLNVRLVKD